MEFVGGRAHRNGVSFSSNTYTVSAFRDKNKNIQTKIIKKPWRKSRLVDWLFKTPFIRGIALYIEIIVSIWKLLVIVMGSFMTIYYGMALFMSEAAYEQTTNRIDAFLIGSNIYLKAFIFICFAILFKKSPLAHYHGAEHKTFHAWKKKRELSIENVREENRVSLNCGTNLAVFIVGVYVLLIACSALIGISNTFVCLFVSLSVGFELFLLPWHSRSSGVLYFLLRPFYLISHCLQKFVFTSEPGAKEIETAIVALQTLQDVERS